MHSNPEPVPPANDDLGYARRPGKVTIAEGVNLNKPRRVNAILAGLNHRGTPIYAGTVFGAEKAKRRAKGKAQRAARKAARR